MGFRFCSRTQDKRTIHTLLMLWQREPQRCWYTWCFLKLVPRSGSCHLHSYCLSQRIHCVALLGINDVGRIKLSLRCSSQEELKERSAYFDNNKLNIKAYPSPIYLIFYFIWYISFVTEVFLKSYSLIVRLHLLVIALIFLYTFRNVAKGILAS